MKGFRHIIAIITATFIWVAAHAADDIVQIASNNKDFSTFVSLLKTADLVTVLQGQGPFTVFAPTNEAFSAIPKNILDNLIAHPEQLKKLLLYHVVNGLLTSDKITTRMQPTIEGQSLNIILNGGRITVNGAEVIQADIQTSNGIIQVVNKVLVPPAQ